MYIIFLF